MKILITFDDGSNAEFTNVPFSFAEKVASDLWDQAYNADSEVKGITF